jgi:hypothetical protein
MRGEITEAQITELMAAIPRAEEVDRLRAEVERLRADLAIQQGCCDGAAAQDAHVRQEREEHRAEVERLRGDAEKLRWAAEDALWHIGNDNDRASLHDAGKSWRTTRAEAAVNLRAAIRVLKEDGR